ncbi:MAG: DUF3343 domain-containing protein [Dehalobacterium sp.]
MAETYDYYVLFPNHQEGLRLHRRLKDAGVKCTISPTPREASSFCGMSLLVNEEDVAKITQVIKESDIKTEGIVQIKRRTAIWNKTC